MVDFFGVDKPQSMQSLDQEFYSKLKIKHVKPLTISEATTTSGAALATEMGEINMHVGIKTFQVFTGLGLGRWVKIPVDNSAANKYLIVLGGCIIEFFCSDCNDCYIFILCIWFCQP